MKVALCFPSASAHTFSGCRYPSCTKHVQHVAAVTRAICCACANWNVSTEIGATWSGASGRLDSRRPRVWTPFDFKAIPSLNKSLVLELARCEWIERRENCIALGPAGTGKTHTALASGLAACQRNHSVLFVTAAALANCCRSP